MRIGGDLSADPQSGTAGKREASQQVRRLQLSLKHIPAFAIQLEIAVRYASRALFFSDKGTFFDVWLGPVGPGGRRIDTGHILRGQKTLSKHAAHGYWGPDQISLRDAQGNERHESQTDFGWKLYLNNPLADCEPPVYMKNSMRLALSQGTAEGRPLQIVTARWQLFEENGISYVHARLNDANDETYSHSANYGEYDPETGEASVELEIPDPAPRGFLGHSVDLQ